MNIEIERKGTVGEHYPRFFYHTQLNGQANYVKRKCEDKAVASEVIGRAVAIYSKRKIPQFQAIIEESFQYEECEQPVMQGENMIAVHGRTTLGVFVIKEGVVHLFTTEKHFADVKYYIFTKQLPRFTFVKIFNSHKEFVEHVVEVEHIII